MAKAISRKPPRVQARIRERKQLKRLRDLGLVSSKTDLRKKPTRAGKKALAEFRDVLRGKAKVLSVKRASDFKGTFKTSGKKKIIVPRDKGEKIFIDARGDVRSVRKAYGVVVKKHVVASTRLDAIAKKKVRRGYRRYFKIPFNRGGDKRDYVRFESLNDLRKFMAEYSRYKDWEKHVEIENVKIGSDDDYNEEDEA